MLISVVVPVYNAEGTLEELIDRLSKVLEPAVELGELILINDGSRDRSWEVVKELASRHEWVRGMDLMRNYGQHNALLCGIRAAKYEVIVTLDDDLQNPPEEIPRLLAKLDEGFDVVYGSVAEPRYGLWRGIGTRLTKLALRIAIGSDIADKVSAFRVFSTHLRESFAAYAGPYVSIDVLLSWGTTRYADIPVAHAARAEGRSSYSFGRLATHALNVLTGFSTRPLRAA